MRRWHLFLRLTLFYALLFGVVWVLDTQFPELASVLPLKGVEVLLAEPDTPGSILDTVEIQASAVTTRAEGALWLVVSILGAVALMVPVSWLYMEIRARDGLDQSLIETMIILPIAVTGIVLVVKNSLALAFSLAGIVAGVQFRNTLKSTADSLFIFMAVGVGLAAGIGQLSVAALMTLLFNYAFLVLWWLEYGDNSRGKRYMRSSHEAWSAAAASDDAAASPEGDRS